MKLKESIHNQLVNLYDTKNSTLEERYSKLFGETELTEQHIEPLGYFILRESFNNDSLNEGFGDFFTGLFSNFGGNVQEQLKEWVIGKVMDWFVKPFIGKIGGEDGAMYENIKRYMQVTFADMPFTEIISTITNCTKVTKLLILGMFEFMLDKMLSSFSFDSVIMDNIRQQLDKSFIEDSALINRITDIADDVVCSRTSSLKDKLKDMDIDFSFA
tara:strand:+ start:6262 stop:6906 length:645 start_codon:yes stop_codon:yes gene_type:complete